MESTQITVALSIRQPWAWLIVNGFKPVENRDWRTHFRGRVLVHAGKKITRAEKEEAAAICARLGITLPETFETGGIVGSVEIVDCVSDLDSPWFRAGGYGWMLARPEVLPFRPLLGKLGFFNVAGDRSFITREVEE